jgi:hypothetical protein
MECGIPVTARGAKRDGTIRRRLALVGLVALGCLSLAELTAAAPGEEAMVLVVAQYSPVHDLDAIDLKRLFLGIPVAAAGSNLRGVLNYSDTRLRELFYEHVMGMTGSNYEQRSLELTLEQGRRVPSTYHDEAMLLAAVTHDGQLVTYAWRSRVQGNPQLRIVRELWHP